MSPEREPGADFRPVMAPSLRASPAVGGRAARVAVLAAAIFVGAASQLLAPSLAGAQVPPAATPSPTPADGRTGASDECFGLTFGRWEPALDFRGAGHPVIAADSAPLRAPHGRDWAARLQSGRDTTIVLFPTWWPAGVAVRFPDGRSPGNDTTFGTATALVADGRTRPPTSHVSLWTVPCAPVPTTPEPAG